MNKKISHIAGMFITTAEAGIFSQGNSKIYDAKMLEYPFSLSSSGFSLEYSTCVK